MAKLVTAVIRKCLKRDYDPKRPMRKQRWCLYTHTGKKLLGRHPSKSKALKQERAVQWRKHGAPSEEQIQTTRLSATEAATMAKNKTPEVVNYRGQLYVYAGEDDTELEAIDEMADEEAPPTDEELDEEMEEVELVEALKSYWQTVLDRLPDDLDVDEEFEEALDGIEEIIRVMEEMGAEDSPEGDDVDVEDFSEEDALEEDV